MSAKQKEPLNFEAGLAALEALVGRLEGEMPLEEAMAAYEEGMRLYAALSAQLDASEKKLRVLSGGEETET